MTDIATLENQISSAIAAATDEAALEAVRVAALGRNGSITALLKTLGTMTPDQRKVQGSAINGLRDRINEALNTRRETFKGAALDARLATETIDVTLPVREAPAEIGRVHPISQVVDELTAIFADMGFSVAEGPDIETDDYNFTKLNFPEGHPAREMHDTFYFPPKPDGSRMLLRTHTSPVQIRTMLKQKPPIRVIIPGRTYRSDSDQTHTPMFHQVEGLVIDKSAHLGHLKWILEEFCKAFFEVDRVKMRFRPSFFPFTEPLLPSAATRTLSSAASSEAAAMALAISVSRAAMSVMALLLPRHGRACPGHPRLASVKEGVDARHKAGHDERENRVRPPSAAPPWPSRRSPGMPPAP